MAPCPTAAETAISIGNDRESQVTASGGAPEPTNDNRSSTGFRLGEDVLMGLRFYSRLPTGPAPHQPPVLNRIALALPFTSVIIGLGPALLLLALEWLRVPGFFAATLAVGAMVIASGAMSEDALADAADGLFGGQTAERRLDIMKDSRHGTYGVVAIGLLLLARVTAIGGLGTPLAAAGVLLTAPLVARSAALWLVVALPPARATGASASVGRLRRETYFAGVGFAALLSLVLAGFAVGWLGLFLAAAFGAATVAGWTHLCNRMVGGQTGDLVGALQALVEIAILAGFMIAA